MSGCFVLQLGTGKLHMDFMTWRDWALAVVRGINGHRDIEARSPSSRRNLFDKSFGIFFHSIFLPLVHFPPFFLLASLLFSYGASPVRNLKGREGT